MTDPVNQLCGRCAGYFDDAAPWVKGGNGITVAPSLEEVRTSAKNDCHFCTLIDQTVTLAANPGHIPYQEYRAVNDETPIELSTIVVTKDENTHGFQMGITFQVRGHAKEVATIFLDPVTPHADHEQTQGMESIQEYSPSQLDMTTQSDKTIDQIKEWADASETMQNKLTWERSSLPSRLLDIGTSRNDDLVRLISTDDLPIGAQYMTLSYCWGRRAFIKLTLSSKDELFRGTKISTLPQTFFDAIQVTRALGIRYLWIDALCIIQDSLEDFSKEVRRMSNLYRRSWMNIAAIDSTDCTGGLFRSRTSRSALPCIIQPTWTCFKEKPKMYAYHRGHYEEVTNKLFFCRGWILQELILSARIVCFSDNQVFWMSQSGYASEAFPQFLPRSRNNIVRKNIYHFVESHVFNPEDPEFHHPLSIWTHILDSFTKKRLTFSRDKLIALAGLADYMAAATKGTLGRYIAGFWETALQYQLGWRVRDGYQEPRPDRPIPSFSWGGVDIEPGAIQWAQTPANDTKIKATECSIDPVFEVGQLENATPSYSKCIALKIRAPFEEIKIISKQEVAVGSVKYRDVVADEKNESCTQWRIYWDTVEDAARVTSDPLRGLLLSTAEENERVVLLLTPLVGECCRYSRVGILLLHDIRRSKMADAFKRPEIYPMCESKGHDWEIV